MTEHTSTPDPIIRSQADLERAWSLLMGPGGFGGHSIWMMPIVDDRPLRQLTEIEDTEAPPTPELVERLADLLRRLAPVVGSNARMAFLRSRPGEAAVTTADREWAAALYDACRRASMPTDVVHLATRGEVRPIPPDDLPASA